MHVFGEIIHLEMHILRENTCAVQPNAYLLEVGLIAFSATFAKKSYAL